MDGVFIKYGEEDHLQQIVDGTLRFSPSDTYVKMEEEQHNKGQGDMLDGKWKIHAMNFRMEDPVTGRVVFEGKNCTFTISIQDVNSMPVFCLSYYGEEYVSNLDGKQYIQLSKEKVAKIKKDFPKATHALIIQEPDRFIEKAEKADNHKIFSDKIHYYDFDINDLRMASFLSTGDENTQLQGGTVFSTTYEDRYRHLLCKDNDFKDQDEYRFIILDELIKEPKKYRFEFKSAYKIVPIDELLTGVEVGL